MKRKSSVLPPTHVSPRYQASLEEVIHCLHEGRYCAVLGPRFSGKTDLLNLVRNNLEQHAKLVAAVNLYDLDTTNAASFFSSLAQGISRELEKQLAMPTVQDVSDGPSFRAFIWSVTKSAGRGIILIIDHLEGVADDLIRLLLTSLRAIYQEQINAEHRLLAIVAGALSLATLTTGETSPFHGIANLVVLDSPSADESGEFIAAFFAKLHVRLSTPALSLLIRASRGNLNLTRALCEKCGVEISRKGIKQLSKKTTEKVIQTFTLRDAAAYKPLQDAVRLIESDPDLLNSVLLVIERGYVRKKQLSLPLSPDVDSLYLTGVVRKVNVEGYELLNDVYRQFLSAYFDPGRIGHLLISLGRWSQAIAYLEASIEAGNHRVRQDLFAATINSIYASPNIKRAVDYLSRGLSAGFQVQSSRTWLLAPDGENLKLAGSLGNIDTRDNEVHGRKIQISSDRLEARSFRESCILRGKEGTADLEIALPLIIPDHGPIGVICARIPAMHGNDAREWEMELTGYLHQCARAIQEIETRQEWRLQIETIDHIVLDILRDWERNRILRTAMIRAVKLVGGSGGGIYLWDDASETFRLEAESGLSELLKKEPFDKDRGVIGVVRRTKQPYSINGYLQWEGRQENLDKYGLTAVVGSPILSGKKFLGAMVVHDKRAGRVFGKQEEKVLRRFANYCAVAIEKSAAYAREHESSEYLKGLISSSVDGIIAVDLDGYIKLYNKSAEQICGYSQEEVFGRKMRVDEIYGDLRTAQDINRRLFNLPEKRFENYETTILHKDGRNIPIVVSAALLMDKSDKHIGSVGFFRDLRPVRKTVEALRAIGEARDLSESLKRLAGGMSENLNATFCCVLLFQGNEESLKLRAAHPHLRDETIKWGPEIGKEISIESSVSLARLYKTSGSRIFRKGEIFEDIDVVSYIRNFVGLEEELESVLLVSLSGMRDMWGVCVVGEVRQWERSPFTEEKIALADSFARQGALYIDRLQLQLRDALLATGKDITSLEELSSKLQNICNRMRDALKCDSIILYPFDEKEQKVGFPPTQSGDLKHLEALKALGYVSKHSVVWKILDSRESHFADVARNDPWMVLNEAERHMGTEPFVVRENISSSAGIPLMVEQERVGVLFINYLSPHTFFQPERKDIEMFAVEIAIAIQNARHLKSEKRHIRQLEAISRVSDAAHSALDLNDLYNAVLAEMVGVFGLDKGGVVIFDFKEGIGRTVAEFPEHKEPIISIPLKGNGSVEQMLKNKKPLAIRDAKNDPMLKSIREVMSRWEVQSMLLIPLMIGGDLIGTIGLDSIGAPREFTEDDLQLADTMGKLMDAAIEKIRSHEEASATETVESTYWLLSRWAHKVRQKSFALGEELRTLRKELPVGLFSEIISNMDASIQELSMPIQKVFSEVEEVREQTLNFGGLMRHVAERLCLNKKVGIHLDLVIEENCQVKGNPLFLELAVEFIIENAIKFMERKERPGKLTVECHTVGDIVQASISDTGIGIDDPDTLKDIFHRPLASNQGLGYGAFTTANILRAYKGDIQVARTNVEGTRIEFWLPAIKTQNLSE